MPSGVNSRAALGRRGDWVRTRRPSFSSSQMQPPPSPIDAPRLTRKGMDDILIYDPHPSGSERHMTPDSRTAPSLRVDLRNADGPYRVEWFRPADGEVLPGDVVRGGAVIELKSPWVGHDVILRLSRDVQN